MTEETPQPERQDSGPGVWLRRGSMAVAALVGLVLVLLAGFLLALQSDRVSTAVVRTAADWVSDDSLRIQVGGASGSWVGGLRLSDARAVRLSGGDTAWSASVDSLAVSWSLLPLFEHTVALDRVRVHGLRASVESLPGDTAATAREDPPASAWTVRADEVSAEVSRVAVALGAEGADDGADAEIQRALDPWTLSDGRVELRSVVLGEARSAVLDTLHVSFRPPGRPTGWGRLAGSGRLDGDRLQVGGLLLTSPESDVRARGTVPLSLASTAPAGLELDLSFTPLHLADVGPFLPPAVADSIRLRGEATLRSVDDSLHWELSADADVPGRVEAEGSLSGPRERTRLRMTAELADVDLGAWGLSAGSPVLGGTAHLDVHGSWPRELRGSLGTELQVEDPGDGPEAHLNLDARTDSSDGTWRGRWSVAVPSLVTDGTATLAPDSIPSWSVEAAIRYRLPPPGSPVEALPGVDVALPRGPTAPSALAGRLEASGTGLAPDSMDARAELRVDSARTVAGASLGPGRAVMELHAGDAEAEVALDATGGRIELAVQGRLPERVGRVMRGSVRGVDLAALLGDTVVSRVGADFHGEITGRDPLRGSATLELQESRWGPWSLASGHVGAELRGETVELRLGAMLPDSGRVAAQGRWVSKGRERRVEVDSLSWSDLDLRTLAAAPDSSPLPHTRLTGTGDATLSGVPAEEGTEEGSLAALRWSGSAAVEMGPSEVGAAVLEQGRATLSLEPTVADLAIELQTRSSGSLSAEARLPTPGQALHVDIESLRLRGLDLGALSGGSLPSTKLTGLLTGSLHGSSPDSARGRLDVGLDSSWVAQTVLDTVALQATLDTGRVEAEGRVAALDGLFLWEGSGHLGARPDYRLRASVQRPPGGSGEAAVFARLGVDGEGLRPDSASVEAWVEVDSARWAGRAVEEGTARASLDDGMLRVDTVALSLRGARIAAGGSLPLRADAGPPGELRATLDISRADVLAGLGPDVLSVGEVTAQATASGTAEDLELQGEGSVSALLVNDIRVQGVELQGRGRRRGGEGWVEGEAHLRVDRMRLPTAPVQSLDLDATLEASNEVALNASAVIDGNRDVDVSARVEDLRGPSAVLLERFAFRADQDRWELAEPTRFELDQGLRVDSLVLAAEGQELRLDGHVASQGPVDLHAAVDSFEISTVADLVGFPTLRGRVSGSLDLTGTGEAPVVQSRVRGYLTTEGSVPAEVTVAAGYEAGEATVDASVDLDDGTGLQADATLPLELSFAGPMSGLTRNAPVRGHVVADSFAVGWFGTFLDPATVRDLEGVLDGEVEMQGRPEAPDLTGSLALTRAGLGLPALGVEYHDGIARLEFQGTGVRLDTVRVRSDDGSLSISGEVAVEEVDNPRYDLAVHAETFEASHTSAVRATVSGDLDVGGSGTAPEVRGRIDVERADLYLGEFTSGSSVDPVTLTEEDWEELSRVFGWQRATEGAGKPTIFETATLDLDVHLGRASWVRQRSSPEMAVQFTGDLAVQKEPGDSIRLVGSVEAVPERSWVEQFGRRFSIEEGRLTFRGPPSATEVDVVAQYDVPSRENPGEPQVALSLTVTGTPDDLSLQLSSSPPLEASDMVAYLVTGRPASQSLSGGEGGSLAGTGGALALGRLSGAVEAYAREEVGLDVVEITTDGLDGITLVAGRYLSPELFLGVRQPLSLQRSSEDPGQRAPTPEIELELQALRWLLLNLRAGGRRGAEFFVRSRLTYD